VSAVLMFRFLYFVIPLSLAITALAIRELRLATAPKAPVASRDHAGDPPP
jgi:uncharacterized membrane protein YbhN (UPF0104 family)